MLFIFLTVLKIRHLWQLKMSLNHKDYTICPERENKHALHDFTWAPSAKGQKQECFTGTWNNIFISTVKIHHAHYVAISPRLSLCVYCDLYGLDPELELPYGKGWDSLQTLYRICAVPWGVTVAPVVSTFDVVPVGIHFGWTPGPVMVGVVKGTTVV